MKHSCFVLPNKELNTLVLLKNLNLSHQASIPAVSLELQNEARGLYVGRAAC